MHTTSNQPVKLSPVTVRRAGELFHEHQYRIHRQTDRMFAGLMILQWLGGIAAALWISPRTWIGTQTEVHIHVWAAVFIGGTIASLPIFLARKHPARAFTRHVIAVAQMLTSALLIHLTGGRIETHFHVFGSLAFLAFYRDWKVLMTATVVVATDHFLRGVFWPQSVFGILASSPWRWVEHAGWVVFEDVFLLISVRQSLQETRLGVERLARLENVNAGVEELVNERTRELKESHSKLVEASRKAGMAEVVTSVLHNVGNVLNSINISASMISDRLKHSRDGGVGKVAGLMREHASDLGTFMAQDPRGRQLPAYLDQLARQLGDEKDYLLGEIRSLARNVDHVKDIVATQQSYAKVSGAKETVQITDLIEDALRMNASALIRHDVHFFREYDENLPKITLEKHKVLQILVNLVRNAKQACDATGASDKRLTMKVTHNRDVVRISVSDNGIGIPPENLPRIFSHGFTTKKDGHGFGLSSGAATATEMGGSLSVTSDGVGKGATFTLELPLHEITGTTTLQEVQSESTRAEAAVH
jgi:signal transduction histidine kinase